MDDDERASRSAAQFAIDALVLALLVGAANGLVVGALRAGVFGVVFGPPVGAFVALVLWVPAVVVARWLTIDPVAPELFAIAMLGGLSGALAGGRLARLQLALAAV